jgi:hypothetical protein
LFYFGVPPRPRRPPPAILRVSLAVAAILGCPFSHLIILFWSLHSHPSFLSLQVEMLPALLSESGQKVFSTFKQMVNRMLNSFPILASMQVLTVAAWIPAHNPYILKPAPDISCSRSCHKVFSREATILDIKIARSLKQSVFNLKAHPASPTEQINTIEMTALTKLCELANDTALAGWQLSSADPTNGRDRDGCIIFL